MKLSKRRAKRITLRVWRYLAANGDIGYKVDLPSALYKKIRSMVCQCPLCEVFSVKGVRDCSACPIGPSCCDMYEDWHTERKAAARSKAAQAIVDKVKAWKVGLFE